MYDLDSLIVDSSVSVGAILFPVKISAAGAGVSPTRFFLFRSPGTEDQHWVAAAWKGSMTGGDPELVFAERVSLIYKFTAQGVDLLLANETRVVVSPVSGCGCGSRLKSFKPFGNTVRMDQVPTPIT